VQADTVGEEALTEDIDQSDVEEQPPPVAQTMTPMLRRSNRVRQPSRRYNAQ